MAPQSSLVNSMLPVWRIFAFENLRGSAQFPPIGAETTTAAHNG
jgi:hypothetical protein